jgi:hypothetical protein
MRCEEGSEAVCPWRAVPHDETRAFAFVHGRNDLELRLSTSPAAAAAINGDPSQPAQLQQDIPILGAVRGNFEGARPPALFAVLAREDACPSGTYAELRERIPLTPESLQVDQSFRVFLASAEGDDRAVHCLARATLRVRNPRALWSFSEDFLGIEVGVLGDWRMNLFLTSPVAMGVTYSLAHFRLSFWRFFAFEIAGGLTVAGSFDPAALSRVGVSLSIMLEVGIPEILPRILAFGGMINGAAQTHPLENPVGSFFLALNLSALYDLAGGR